MTLITVTQGTLIGGECATENGYKYTEFVQIPYAKPPLGDLRFKAPQPPEPWEGERDATTADDTHICPQIDIFTKTLKGSEDCLYLNVYTPELPTEDSKLLPVMVYIHGGGFVVGNGTIKADGGPDFLIEHDVVVVTVNYRLGVFGFLSLDIPEAAGNMGLKDQVMALKWIQNNIDKFGGDKDNVTIFGISAGSAAIEYLILSPLCKGLFHKAILQSGSALNHWALALDIKELTIKLAAELGYSGSTSDVRGIHDFLMKQSTEVIANGAFERLPNLFTSKRTCFSFVPSIEKDFGDGNAFITEKPYDILKAGNFNKVSVIKGFCEFEGYMILGMKPHVIKELADNKNLTDLWAYPLVSSNIYNEKFIEAYFNNRSNDDVESKVVAFVGDFDFSSGIWIGNKILAEHNVPVYAYMFAYDAGSNSISRKFFSTVNKPGASHGADSNFVMKINNFLTADIIPTDVDMQVTKRMTKMWTDFAKTGNPTPSTSELISVQWPLFDNNSKQYLKIDQDLEMLSDYMPDKMAVFQEIYEKNHL